MFAIKEAQECVISEYLCESDWRRNSLIPSACLKTPQHIFQLAVKVDIQSARQEEKKKTMWPLFRAHILWGTFWSVVVKPNLCSNHVWWDSYPILHLMRNIIQYVLCLHSQIRVTHWISFLCQFSRSLWCFWFGLPSQCIHHRVS